MKKNEGTLLQENHIGVHELIELEQVVHIVQNMQSSIVVCFYSVMHNASQKNTSTTNRMVKSILINVLEHIVSDSSCQRSRGQHQECIVDHDKPADARGLPVVHNPLNHRKTDHIAANDGNHCRLRSEGRNSLHVAERGIKVLQNLNHVCSVQDNVQEGRPHSRNHEIEESI